MRGIDQRTFVSGVGTTLLASSVPARAQTTKRPFRIGILTTANPRSASFYQAFEQRLRELGYVEGDNTVIDFRTADGNVEKLPELAAALVRLEPALIVSSTDLATRAVKNATKSIPILMVAINYDPVFHGYVDSLARPGGNVT